MFVSCRKGKKRQKATSNNCHQILILRVTSCRIQQHTNHIHHRSKRCACPWINMTVNQLTNVQTLPCPCIRVGWIPKRTGCHARTKSTLLHEHLSPKGEKCHKALSFMEKSIKIGDIERHDCSSVAAGKIPPIWILYWQQFATFESHHQRPPPSPITFGSVQGRYLGSHNPAHTKNGLKFPENLRKESTTKLFHSIHGSKAFVPYLHL